MGEKGQPTTSRSSATSGAAGAFAGNTVGVPLQQGAVQQDSDWGGAGGTAGNTVGVPLHQGAVQQDGDWGGTGGIAGNTVGVPLQQGTVQQDSDWGAQDTAQQGGEKGQAGTDTLANMNLQKELQKESQSQEEVSNISKHMSDTATSIISKEGA